MESRNIVVRGARVHNLKNVDLELPKNQLICFTGVSGSGKSSLAFDTLYAEGQRRYVASLSAYARQFLGQMEKPDVDQITGLAPTISISQKTGGHNPRSTVGTITEIYDYLRVLYARVGTPHCVQCERPIGAQTREQIGLQIAALGKSTQIQILAPVVEQRKGEYSDLFEDLQRSGFLRIRIDGHLSQLEEAPQLDRYSRHDIEVVVDRLDLRGEVDTRLSEAVDNALQMGNGQLIVARENKEDWLLSSDFFCGNCSISYRELNPQMFSFNNPQGMCTGCGGLGTQVQMSEQLMIPDTSKSVSRGTIEPLGDIRSNRWRLHLYQGAAEHLGFDLDTPWRDLTARQKQGFLRGLGDDKLEFTYTNVRGYSWSHKDRYEGVLKHLEERFHSGSERARRGLEPYMGTQVCDRCHGGRLRSEALAVTFQGTRLHELTSWPIEDARSFFQEIELGGTEHLIAEDALQEIRGRLELLVDIGLGYLTLDRGAHTLSGGEAQRIRLASQIGSGLVGVLYVLDEPSIGLHHRDNERLLATLKRLRNIGNTVVVVEHDEDTIREADMVCDFGPGAGERGGQLVISGKSSALQSCAASLTGQYLAGTREIAVPVQRRSQNGHWLEIIGARQNNLKGISARIPLGLFTCVTGVSGSGKSSLVNDILFKALDRQLHRAQLEPGAHERLQGVEQVDKVIRIDQKPIGRTPRSNPATYTNVWTPIRQLFAQVADAKVRGYRQGRFSFNVKGGRCDACEGSGAHLVEMEFLSDVWITCEACDGRRFNRETLSIKYKEKSIADVLDMEVEEALAFFANLPHIHRILQTLHGVGLGYIKLGQPAPTLSGGEAQRVKLAKELCRRSTGQTVYILDEPTTGLHFADVDKLLHIMHTFADQGNTVVVVEHNLEVIKTADYIIDMGPEGGAAGGEIVAEGTPESITSNRKSFTGQALEKVLRRNKPAARTSRQKQRPKTNGHPIEHIDVVGARMHNLRDVDLRIPRDKMTVVSGVSGSGKSSLAFDTIYAEGQRRYVESLSSYARQFLDQMQKPKVEKITGLSPAIAIEQKSPTKNPRSTVGTVTEVYDYLRALFANIGVQYCPRCNVAVGAQTSQQIVDRILESYQDQRLLVLSPIEPARNEGYETLLRQARQDGFARVRIGGKIHDLTEEIELERRHRHRVELVVDRLSARKGDRGRLNEAVERAVELSGGEILVLTADGDQESRFSKSFSCPQCGNSFDPLNPRRFSFNHQEGMCQICEGLGIDEGFDRDLVFANRGLSVRAGAIAPWGLLPQSDFTRMLEIAGAQLGFDLDTPVSKMAPDAVRSLLYGDYHRKFSAGNGLQFAYRGLLHPIDDFIRTSKRHRKMLREVPCSACEGSRLKPESRNVRIQGTTLVELTRRPMSKCLQFFQQLELNQRETEMAGELLQEVRLRLHFLNRVGLGYISLERRVSTLSGGETQRIRLAGQIGSGLTGVLYLLDEPTIGLHARDTRRLLDALDDLKKLGNTLVLVEHDRETLERADFIADMGPGAGRDGGELVGCGPPSKFKHNRSSKTGAYLLGRLRIDLPSHKRKKKRAFLKLRGARQNNLKNIDVEFPLESFICITGVSGSGKSSLVQDTLYNALASKIHGVRCEQGDYDALEGIELIDKIIDIDQSQLGHSPRSTPATVMGVFSLIRELYSQLPDAKVRGFAPGRFSFNRPGGRCESCEGLGWRCIEMHFLPDVWVRCDHCLGKRFTAEILDIQFKFKSVADILEMTVHQALALFDNVPNIAKKLQTMEDVGLGYMLLGQSSTTFSGGEAQRLKLANELARPNTGNTFYILDEPTTGLHCVDIQNLLNVIHRLVASGNTVLVVEHNMDVIKNADHIVDLGPEGGNAGGAVVAVGTPTMVSSVADSHTGQVLKETLGTTA